MKTALLSLLFLVLISNSFAKDKPHKNELFSSPKSDVYMEGFYWDSPPGGVWWDSLAKLAPRLASAGFNGIWFPDPVKGASGSLSMGYDPFDHYDFGDYDQRGTIPTRFGTRTQLVNSIQAFHDVGINVYADAVMLFMNGGETQHYQCTPSGFTWPDSEALSYSYPNGSGRFPKDSTNFYPNALHCDISVPYHGPSDLAYKFGVWLDKDPGPTRDSLIVWGRYLKNVIGFDGFRLDAVKNIDPAFVGAWLDSVNSGGYAVAEYFSSTSDETNWLNSTLSHGGSVAMFDFDLRYALKAMCNTTDGSYNMTNLDGTGLVNNGVSGYNASTFVENHDMDRIGYDGLVDGSGHDPIVTDKILAYAYTIFSEGRPCVFFKDYFMYGLGRQIDSLIWIRQNFLAGGTTKRGGLNAYYIGQSNYSTDQNVLANDIYVAMRGPYGGKPECYLVINDNSSHYLDVWVDTDLPVGTAFKDYSGHDVNKHVVGPDHPGGKNRLDLYAPKRAYTIYVPDTTKSINHPPVVAQIPDQVTYTNKAYSYQVAATDADNNPLSYYLTNSPGWLSIGSSGLLSGTPVFADTAIDNIIVTVDDNHGSIVSDTFHLNVQYNRRPVLTVIHDTTVSVTKRYQYQVLASDPDNDVLTFSLLQGASWLTLGPGSGVLSGTADIGDIGDFPIKITTTDNKGGLDTTAFTITVASTHDSVIATYGKPTLDGTVNIGSPDWSISWQRQIDSSNDSKWWKDSVHADNELYGLYATWDADSLYLGVSYMCNDSNNTLMIYVDAGIAGGQTNFNSHQGYTGAYPKNDKFRPADAIDYFIADYQHDKPHLFKTVGAGALHMDSVFHGVRGPAGHDMEAAISWNDIYGLGAGLVPANVKLKFVSLIAGGDNWGSGDACPNNPDVNGDSGPDSLINFVTIMPDSNGDGIPDPTVFIDTVINTHPRITSQIGYTKGWKIVSVPLTVSDNHKTVLFPDGITPAFNYDTTGYVQKDTLSNGYGYWVKFASAKTESFNGYEITKDTIKVHPGWNMIGSLSTAIPTSSVQEIPVNGIISLFYGYLGTYSSVTTLQPGFGYWVKVSVGGKLVFTK